MTILRAVRALCALIGVVAFIGGAISLFQVEWGRFGFWVLAWFVAMLVFGVAQNGIERAERGDVAGLLSGVESLAAVGDWQGALSRTTEATRILEKSVRAVGKRSDQVGPLASALVMHSLMLGANGDVEGAQSSASRATRLLERLPNPTPLGREILASAQDIEEGVRACNGNRAAVTQLCKNMV
jgi:hypothetical protein